MRHVFMLSLLSLLTVVCAELPEYITKCKISDPKFNACLKQQANRALINITDGDDDLEIPTLNPARIPRLLLAPTKKFQLDLRNCDTYGLDKLKVNDIKLDTKFQTLDIVANVQNPTWICIYKAKGELLNKTFDDRGFINITFVNCSTQYTADYQSAEMNETSYYQVKNDAVLINVDQITFNLTHADGSADDQAKQLNKILNEEYHDFEKEFIPSIKVISSRIITHIVNQFFRSVPADKLFDL